MNPENLFMGVRNIRFLYIRNGNLTEIPESLLSTLPNLANLYMNSNQINNISINTFKMNKMLSRLDLSENNINFIPSEMFKSQNNLKYLLLTKNKLTRITKGMFKYLYRLKYITLNNNHIEFIEENSFDYVFLLDALLLEDNKLEYLPRDIFKRNRIRSLYLSGNRLTSFDNLYQDIPYLLVKLNNNKFTYLELPIMKISTKHVELNNNQIEFINITKTILNYSSTIIELKNNPLKCDCKLLKFYHYFKSHKDTFKNNIGENLLCNSPTNMKGRIFNSLEENNFICNIEENCPEQCKCYIREMDRTTFMDCSDSKLVTLPTEVVHNVKNWELPQFLENVNLQNNNLSWLSSDIFKLSEFNSFKIKLGNNPWNCICNISSMIYWLKSIREKVEDLEDVTCENSVLNREKYIHIKLHEIEIKSICFENVEIRPSLHIYILVISSIAISIIIVIIVLYYKYKQTVLAYLYIHGYRLFLCFYNEEEMDEDKKYDAFISYSHEDRDVASVRESRRTVLVLSEVFLRSPWFPIEFKTVYHQMMEDRMDRIILVIKGELPDISTLDPDLQFLLQTKTYLEWNERWFWEKIRYALPHKNKSKRKITLN
ncbi:Tl [Cordylochernes scorpioides]|uniref:Tl n=1 Tax=Cordylochernes scorpioides TaxID=51811 RepID=A0ABY6KIE5_9ARAC|nr:Tl [Cordylochernes scorpioides]